MTVCRIVLAVLILGCAPVSRLRLPDSEPPVIAVEMCVPWPVPECIPRFVLYANGQAVSATWTQVKVFEYPEYHVRTISRSSFGSITAFAESLEQPSRWSDDRKVWASEGSDPVRYSLFVQRAEASPALSIYGAVEPGPVGNRRERGKLELELQEHLDEMFAFAGAEGTRIVPDEVVAIFVPWPGTPDAGRAPLLSGIPSPQIAAKVPPCLPHIEGVLVSHVPGESYERLRAWWKELGPDRLVQVNGATYHVVLRVLFPGSALWNERDSC